MRLALLAALAASAAALPAAAQHTCDVVSAAEDSSARVWPPPLDTRLSVRVRDIALREALDRISAAARVPVAYASDLLPVDQPVCLAAQEQPLGRVLAALLAGTRVEASVVAGRVVLTPRATGDLPAGSARRIGQLERVLVTGSAITASRRPLTVGVEVIDGERLRRESLTSLAAILDEAVPGMWAWEQAPSSLVASYGGIRGASSFNTSYPKIYIDGVEVANPLLVTHFDPDAVERIEVIRGPQGSALYGSDAISGVINVVTRHGGSALAGSRLRLSSTAGGSATAYGAGVVPTHDQRLTLRTGSNLRSAGLGVEFGQTGAVVPSTESRQLLVVGDARMVRSRAVLSATGRYFDKRAGAGTNPLLAAFAAAPADSAGALAPQSVRQYTLGGSAAFSDGGPWTHTALLGVDGYALDHVGDVASRLPVSVDSALRAAQGSGDRATMRLTSVGRLGAPEAVLPATVTLGVEHSVLRLVRTVGAAPLAPPGDSPPPVAHQSESWTHNTGLFAQTNLSWRETFYLTGGLRVERNDAFSGDDRYPLLPMLGVANVRDLGNGATLKLRTAYGKGIRPPQTPARSMAVTQQGPGAPPSALDPEVQSGIETGAELYVGGALVLQVTRFDQVASGLIQNVAVAVDTGMRDGTRRSRARYELQNVGEIGNHGWELQSTLRRGALSVAGALTFVDSRVRTTAPGYGGDLRPGDRVLAVPARTGSLTASWTAARWSTTLAASRAADWINYDQLALARDFATVNGGPLHDYVGAYLRGYWRRYDGDTHLRVTGSRELARGVELLLTGDNLLGGQTGEPDDATIRAGRTIMGGLRASF